MHYKYGNKNRGNGFSLEFRAHKTSPVKHCYNIAMASSKANSGPYDDQAREIIKNVYQVCAAEKKDGHLHMPLSSPFDRTTHLCNVSWSTVQRLVCHDETTKACQPVHRKVELDDFDLCVVRRTVQTMYEKRKVLPTLDNIRNELRETISYTGGKKALSKTLKNIGFEYRRSTTNRKVLMERSDIVLQGINFLRTIKELRDNCRTIVYTDETFVHSCHSTAKCWQSKDVGLNVPFSKGERMIIVHAGSKNGFIPGAALIYKASSSTGDYHNEMNFDNFMKWLEQKLIPNLPEKSVLILDNVAYHNVQIDKCPTQSTRKADIQLWLQRHGIPFTAEMLKPELLELCKTNKPAPTYRVDQLLKTHGHLALRLPPYHADLNAIELIWSNLKGYIGRRNLRFRMADVQSLIQEGVDSIGEKEWSACCSHVEAVELEYRKRDIAVDEEVERVLIYVDSDSDVSDDSTDTASEGDKSTDSAEESKLFM